MNKYNFRSTYRTYSGVNISDISWWKLNYMSPISRNGTGFKENPYGPFRPHISDNNPTGSTVYICDVLANGMYQKVNISLSTGNYSSVNYELIGQHMMSTMLSPIFKLTTGNTGAITARFRDLRLTEWTLDSSAVNIFYYFRNCCIDKVYSIISGSAKPYYATICLLKIPNNSSSFTDQGYNSYLYTDIVNIINVNALYDNCKVTLDSQARLTTYKDTWAAFNDCKFKIGTEADWTPLTGITEEALRANFVARCQAQGFAVPAGTDTWDKNLPMYRWVFATNSAKNGVPLKNSIINNFEKRKFQIFGYETKRDGFVISTDVTAKNSFNLGSPNSVTPNAGIEFDSNSLKFTSSTDITDPITAVSQSNIMWLGGKHKLTALDIVHNMPAEFGVMVDSTPTIDFTPVNSGGIEADELYIVRSTDKNYAAVTYNGVAYSTALSNNNYVFKGLKDKTIFAITGGNPVIYKLTDFVQHQTMELRIVNKLPEEKIMGGALKNNYWYFVEHDSDQANTSDYITYNGKNYFAGSSFLVKDNVTNFAVKGNIHLRRAWIDSFNYETMPNDDIDKEFWRYEQKPVWCKIVIGDTPRCFMTSNSDRENEMKSKDNEYLTTGHPDFYKMENGDGGLKIPSFPIQGSYIQLRMMITTINPM